MVSYISFACAYDEVLGKFFLKFLLEKFKEIEKKYNLKRDEILDLGCGTGLFLKFLNRKNEDFIGIDQSYTMLFFGKKDRNFSSICLRFPPIPLKRRFSLIVSFYDTLNHILIYKELEETFKEVKRLLKEGGYFLFDTNNLMAFKKILGNPTPHLWEGEEGRIEMKTSYNSFLKISRTEIEGIFKGKKIKDEIYERYWSEREILNGLKKAGFKNIFKEEWALTKIYKRKPLKDFWIVS